MAMTVEQMFEMLLKGQEGCRQDIQIIYQRIDTLSADIRDSNKATNDRVDKVNERVEAINTVVHEAINQQSSRLEQVE